MDIKNILDEYRVGDEGQRLRLFLAFRDLRDYFSLIDQENPTLDLTLFRFPWTRAAKVRTPFASTSTTGLRSARHFKRHAVI